MKANELILKSDVDLVKLRSELQAKRLQIRFSSALKGAKMRPSEYGAIRKDIARINTVLREKKLKAEV